jgi:preprotein translocase subunit SecF
VAGIATLGNRLYFGEASIDFVRRQKLWYTISAVFIALSILGLAVRGLNLGIEFKGGAVFTAPAHGHSISSIRDAVEGAGVDQPIVQTTNNGMVRIETPPLSPTQATKVEDALAKELGVSTDALSPQTVGSSWGAQITQKAIISLIVFLLFVVSYLSIRLDFKMAIAALIALVHDVFITIGIYALVGFQVTPSTVIGLLTILGYSLYDTVVVFDKVRENTADIRRGSRMTYSDAANLGVNQTLVRSINTSLIALLPVAAILFVGAGVLGAGTLEDLALALFVGIACGTYSSIFIATPLLADFKEREPEMQMLAKRVATRRSSAAAAVTVAEGGTERAGAPSTTATAVLERDSNPEPEPDGYDADEPETAAQAENRQTVSGPRQQPRRQSRSGRRSGPGRGGRGGRAHRRKR